MLKLLPEWLKLGAAAIAALVIFGPVIHFLSDRAARSDERARIEAKAAKEALERIGKLEQNNASFRNLDARHRCIVFARDSGLPDTICD